MHDSEHTESRLNARFKQVNCAVFSARGRVLWRDSKACETRGNPLATLTLSSAALRGVCVCVCVCVCVRVCMCMCTKLLCSLCFSEFITRQSVR